MKRFAVPLFLLLTTFPLFGGEVLIPAVYRGGGAHGTNWRTEIVLSNIATGPVVAPIPVTVTYHGNDGQRHEVRQFLSPMEVIDIPDALFGWWALENAAGIVLVTWEDDPKVRIVARARVYNLGEHGQYGQAVPGVESSKLVTDHFLTGLTGTDGNRTNVGISNPSSVGTLFWITLYDTSGASRGAFATYVGPKSYRQFDDIFSHFQAGPLNAAMVRITASDAAVYAYASIVRNDTGDASFVVSQ